MPKVASHPTYQNSIIRKKFTVPFLKYKRLKLKLRVFLAGHSVAMVIYSVTKIIPTCSPVIGQFFDTMMVASIVIMTHQNLSLGMCWKLFWATLNTITFWWSTANYLLYPVSDTYLYLQQELHEVIYSHLLHKAFSLCHTSLQGCQNCSG